MVHPFNDIIGGLETLPGILTGKVQEAHNACNNYVKPSKLDEGTKTFTLAGDGITIEVNYDKEGNSDGQKITITPSKYRKEFDDRFSLHYSVAIDSPADYDPAVMDEEPETPLEIPFSEEQKEKDKLEEIIGKKHGVPNWISPELKSHDLSVENSLAYKSGAMIRAEKEFGEALHSLVSGVQNGFPFNQIYALLLTDYKDRVLGR